MREIKFRAWSKKYKDMWFPVTGVSWVVVKYYDEPERELSETVQTVNVGYKDSPNPASNIELMQFTGLKDKNGVEIFEGDIVTDGNWIGEIKWCEAGYDNVLAFHPINNEGHYNHYYGGWDGSEFEVIGNIYSNPELLQ